MLPQNILSASSNWRPKDFLRHTNSEYLVPKENFSFINISSMCLNPFKFLNFHIFSIHNIQQKGVLQLKLAGGRMLFFFFYLSPADVDFQ